MLRGAVQAAHQFVTFATAAPLQAAVAEALRLPDAFFAQLATTFSARRALLTSALTEAGLAPHPAEGSYFVIAAYTHLPGAARFATDFDFCRWLTTEIGVAAIPPSAFYLPEHAAEGQGTARFAFCKKDETLHEAARRLKKIAG